MADVSNRYQNFTDITNTYSICKSNWFFIDTNSCLKILTHTDSYQYRYSVSELVYIWHFLLGCLSYHNWPNEFAQHGPMRKEQCYNDQSNKGDIKGWQPTSSRKMGSTCCRKPPKFKEEDFMLWVLKSFVEKENLKEIQKAIGGSNW